MGKRKHFDQFEKSNKKNNGVKMLLDLFIYKAIYSDFDAEEYSKILKQQYYDRFEELISNTDDLEQLISVRCDILYYISNYQFIFLKPLLNDLETKIKILELEIKLAVKRVNERRRKQFRRYFLLEIVEEYKRRKDRLRLQKIEKDKQRSSLLLEIVE